MQIILAFDLELTNQFDKVNTFFWIVIEFIGLDWSPQGHKVKWFACGGMQLEQLMSHYITRTVVATIAKYNHCFHRCVSVNRGRGRPEGGGGEYPLFQSWPGYSMSWSWLPPSSQHQCRGYPLPLQETTWNKRPAVSSHSLPLPTK